MMTRDWLSWKPIICMHIRMSKKDWIEPLYCTCLWPAVDFTLAFYIQKYCIYAL
jgi:hypothetical protein